MIFDQRGDGESDVPEEGYDIARFADAAASLCQELGIDQPVVVGHSMGGVIAFEMASWPDPPVRAVAGIDSPLFPAQRTGCVPRAGGRAGYGAGERGTPRLYCGMFIEDDDPDEKARIIDSMTSTPERVVAACVQGICEWAAEDALRNCRTPALVVSATVFPAVNAELAKKMCPHLVTEQTVGTGHFNQLLAPDQVNAALERFMASLN